MTPGKLFILILLSVWSSLGFSSQSIHIPPDLQELEIGTAVEYWEDVDQDRSFEAIVAAQDLPWKPSLTAVPNYGFTKSAYWLRFTVETASYSSRRLYLQIAYPALDKLDLYMPRPDGTFVRQSTVIITPLPRDSCRTAILSSRSITRAARPITFAARLRVRLRYPLNFSIRNTSTAWISTRSSALAFSAASWWLCSCIIHFWL